MFTSKRSKGHTRTRKVGETYYFAGNQKIESEPYNVERFTAKRDNSQTKTETTCKRYCFEWKYRNFQGEP